MTSQTRTIMIVLIVHYFLIFSLSAQAQWFKQSNGLPDDWIHGFAMDACDSNTAVISIRCSDAQPNKLFLTNNSGKNWHELFFPYLDVSDMVIDVSIHDNSFIWITTMLGKIYATTDAGLNWSLQFCDSTKTQYLNYIEMFDVQNGVAMGDALTFGGLNSVYFINENIGWAVGKVYFGAGLERPGCNIFKTTDGGINWIPLTSQNVDRLNSVHFINPGTGWAVGEQCTILSTHDGGATWLSQNIPTSENLKSVQFVNSKIGWIIGSRIWKTTDSGDSWKDQTMQLSHAYYSCHFVDENTGWIVGINSSKALIINTNDGGESWSYQDSATENGLLSVHFSNQTNGWAVGLYGTIVSTKDGGINWEIQNSGTKSYLWSVYFSDDSTGWVCGNEGTVLKTSDGGEKWELQKYDFSLGFKSINFINSTTGWVVGNNGIIFKTTNGGLYWGYQFGERPKPALILTTTDGGLNWIVANHSYLLGAVSGLWWRRIDFVNSDIGYYYASFDYSSARINPHKIFKTMDAGRTWLSIDYPDYANAVKFYDKDLGIVSAQKFLPSRDAIYKTRDGGNTWQNYGEVSGRIMDIEFMPGDPSKVWITTDSRLCFSSDTGKTWTYQNIYSRGEDIVFVDSHNGWLLCDDGVIYHTTSGGSTQISSKMNDQPGQYTLLRNFPNPFNSLTTIQFSVPKQSDVTFKIYNTTGQEITQLFHKTVAPGNYSVNWDGKNHSGQSVSSGLYFAKVFSEDKIQTIKLLLIR